MPADTTAVVFHSYIALLWSPIDEDTVALPGLLVDSTPFSEEGDYCLRERRSDKSKKSKKSKKHKKSRKQ